MSDWRITESISNGIEKGLDKIADKLTNAVMESLCTVFSHLLDGIGTFIIIIAMYYVFKFMFTIKQDKQDENVNVLVSLGGIYFIVKMFAVMLS